MTSLKGQRDPHYNINYLREVGLTDVQIARALDAEEHEVRNWGGLGVDSSGLGVNAAPNGIKITLDDLRITAKALMEKAHFKPEQVPAWFEQPCQHAAELAEHSSGDGSDPGVSRLKLISTRPIDVLADACGEAIDRMNTAAATE